MENATENPWLALFNVVLGLALALFGAWVITCLWSWYLVPVGLPAISLKTAFGLDLLVSMLTTRLSEDDRGLTSEQVTHRLVERGLCLPAMLLVLGWGGLVFFG